MPTKLAVFVTFVASGVYHDYVWKCIFYNPQCPHEGCYEPQLGRVTAFFAYIGFLILLERPFSQTSICKALSKLPTVVVAHLFLLLHLPVLHWYLGDWIRGGYYEHFAIALWHIKPV